MTETQAPGRRWPKWWIVPTAAAVVLVLLGVLVVRGGDDRGARFEGGESSSSPEAEATSAGPRPSTTPVRDADDLGRVCDGWYYPGSPRYAGRPPHPIGIGVVDRADDVTYRVKAALDVPYTLSERNRNAWMPRDAARAQLVACVTLVRSGAAVKTCTVDDARLPMRRGVYRLALYEVATRRELLRKQLTGDATGCPTAVPLGAGRTGLTSTVSDRRLYESLRRYVVSQSTVASR